MNEQVKEEVNKSAPALEFITNVEEHKEDGQNMEEAQSLFGVNLKEVVQDEPDFTDDILDQLPELLDPVSAGSDDWLVE